jgi:hypothetical protein
MKSFILGCIFAIMTVLIFSMIYGWLSKLRSDMLGDPILPDGVSVYVKRTHMNYIFDKKRTENDRVVLFVKKRFNKTYSTLVDCDDGYVHMIIYTKVGFLRFSNVEVFEKHIYSGKYVYKHCSLPKKWLRKEQIFYE